MEKILSIVIPTYNMEKYLRRCSDSLLVNDANMKLLEVIVVNDGSKDSSSQIAHEYEKRFPDTFRVIDKENGNYGSCINRGLKEVTGKYIKVLDADDWFDNQVFEKFMLFLQNTNTDLIVSDFSIVDENGCVSETGSFSLTPGTECTLNDLNDTDIKWLWHHAITYKHNLFSRIDYHQTEGISYTDDEWIFKPMLEVKTISYFNKSLYRYLRGREGQTFAPEVLAKSFGQRIKVAISMLDFFVETKDRLNDNNKIFMTSKIKTRLESIYYYCLAKNSSNILIEKLKEFDQYILQKSEEIYYLLDGCKSKIGGCYIKKWRMSNYKKTFSIFLMQIRERIR